jgi:hypothetical protein
MSVWQRKDGAMLWAIQNNSSKTANGFIGLKGMLAVKPGMKASNLLDGKSVDMKNGLVQVKILPYEGLLVKIK